MTNSSTSSFPLEDYAFDLTQIARDWTFPPLKDYEEWVARIFSILLRKEKMNRSYNPVLIDGDETRRWRVVVAMLRCLATGEAPDPLLSLRIIAPNLVALCDASPNIVQRDGIRTIEMASEAEKQLTQLLSWPAFETWGVSAVVLPRFEAFFSAACQREDQVLLLNDLHRLFGGEPGSYAIDVAPLLVPPLARRQMQLIGISKLAQFQQYIERDGAIQCRVQPVML